MWLLVCQAYRALHTSLLVSGVSCHWVSGWSCECWGVYGFWQRFLFFWALCFALFLEISRRTQAGISASPEPIGELHKASSVRFFFFHLNLVLVLLFPPKQLRYLGLFFSGVMKKHMISNAIVAKKTIRPVLSSCLTFKVIWKWHNSSITDNTERPSYPSVLIMLNNCGSWSQEQVIP